LPLLDNNDNDIINNLLQKIEDTKKDDLTGQTKENANKLKTALAKKTDPRLPYQKRTTYIIASGIAAINLVAILLIGVKETQLDITIPFVAVITFFGVMMLSAQHNHSKEEMQEKHSTGVMRRSIAASVVLVYLIAFSAITFGDFNDRELSGEVSDKTITKISEYFEKLKNEEGKVDGDEINKIFGEEQQKLVDSLQSDIENELKSNQTILGHFTIMTGIVIAFYFGSKAVESRKNGDSKEKPSTKPSDGDDDSKPAVDALMKLLSKNPDDMSPNEHQVYRFIKEFH
jgi:hypothetical protein